MPGNFSCAPALAPSPSLGRGAWSGALITFCCLQIVADSKIGGLGAAESAANPLHLVSSDKRARRDVVHLVTGECDEGAAIEHFEDAVLPAHGFR
jgi:hypothetical protein